MYFRTLGFIWLIHQTLGGFLAFNPKNYLSAENVKFASWEKVEECTRKFLEIMDEALVKFSDQYGNGRCNTLVVSMRDTTSLLQDRNSDYLDRWIKLVVDKSFRDLHLNLWGSPHYYVLPKVILNARSLSALSIRRCKLPNIGHDVVICLDTLQQLKLVNCFCDQRSFGNLISACHALRELSIIECSGFTELNLHLCKMKELMVRETPLQNSFIRKVIVRGTCLVSFSYVSSAFFDHPCQIILDACKKLESLCLECLVFPEGFSPDICQNFPLLRSLILRPARGLERVFVSSKKLESLSFVHAIKFDTLSYTFITRNVGLQYCRQDPTEVVIRAPNLKFFNYVGRSLEQLSAFSKFSPYGWIKKVKLYGRKSREMDAKWFLSLADTITQLGPNLKLSLHVEPLMRWSFNIKKLGDARFRRLGNVEHLKLKALFGNNDLCLLTNGSLMAGLLWSFHPKTLSLSVPLNSNIKRLREDLLKRIKSRGFKDIFRGWPHDSKDFMVEYVVEPKCRKEVKDPCRRIKFSFIWCGTDNL